MRTKSVDVSTLEPIEPTNAQLINSALFDWSYDSESLLFYKGDKIGYFTTSGFYTL